jgi:hypothetical protein
MNRWRTVGPNGSLFRLAATQAIAPGLLRPMLGVGRRGTTRRFCLALLVAVVLPLSIAAQSPEPDPNTAGSDVVGKLMPVRSPTSVNNVPAVHRQTMEANLQQFVAIVLRDSALHPPVGFDFRTGTHAYAPPLPVSRHAPLAYTMTGLFYWYTYMPAYGRVRPLDIALQGFFVRANDISNVFSRPERWQTDEQGLTYWEPREIRRVAGFPQYSTGAVVLKRNPRPIWVPVSREWALQRELVQARKNLKAVAESAAAADAFDPTAALETWLRERPERQREMEKSYEETKRSNPGYAEKIRANFFEFEKSVERTMRDTAERQKAAPPHKDPRLEAERRGFDKCIRYLEGELARLSPADRAAPAYVSVRALDLKTPSREPGCSLVVDANFPDATRIVRENPDYYNAALPPGAIQVIVVDFSNFEGTIRVTPPWRHAVYERMRDGLDYSALAAMLQE